MRDPDLWFHRYLTVPVCVAHLTSVMIVTIMPEIPGMIPWVVYRNCFLGGVLFALTVGLYRRFRSQD